MVPMFSKEFAKQKLSLVFCVFVWKRKSGGLIICELLGKILLQQGKKVNIKAWKTHTVITTVFSGFVFAGKKNGCCTWRVELLDFVLCIKFNSHPRGAPIQHIVLGEYSTNL